MRVESVTAEAFGALAGAHLDLAPGCTVVAGGNEAGKSTWFAAIVAALGGRRRGRGRRRADEQEFAARHHPWDGGPWSVRAVVALADGRRVELRQDLAAATGTATDLALGEDVTAEVLHEGVPDATRWIGLDRDVFAATGAVGQAEVLAVATRAGELQEHLQRAADRARPDATAAAALARLTEFRASRVGTPRAITRPRARAEARRVAADEALAAARVQHRRTDAAAEAADRARAAADEAAGALASAERARAARRRALDAAADEVRARLARPTGARAAPGRVAAAAVAVALVAGALVAAGAWPRPAGLVAVGLVAVGLVAVGLAGWRFAGTARRDAVGRDALRQQLSRLGRATDALDADVERHRAQHLAAEGDARHHAGRLEQLLADRPDVAVAEEELAAAEAECARLDRLDATLATTVALLERAQAEVQRSIAPVLAAEAAAGVARVTGGRYREVTVDPRHLAVSVRGPRGAWRDARHLSRGTAEQVHLLLRLALADHLADGAGRCPLLLDDVTVHADRTRTAALLGLLADLARDRQVVLFTQQDAVVTWAEAHLAPGRDRLVRLGGPIGG